MPKTLLVLWVLVLGLAGCAREPDHAADFQRANAQLQKGHYVQAIRQYQQLERRGVQQPALFCNLGNAFYQSGRLGWAVYYYEKALALAPLDAQLIANSRVAQARTRPPAAGWWPAPTTMRALKVADAGAVLAVVSLFISSILYLIGVVANGGVLPAGRLAACRLLLLAAALLLVAAGGALLPRQQPAAIITLPKAQLHSGPSSLARKVAEAAEGEKVAVQASYRGWLKIQTTSGEQGWVATASAARLPE
ncbi:MAG: tetratricopeptide repeat protein [Janthinobacterium lividum]